ncbi:MAG TPA: hypothetical protein VHF45_12785 [Thermoleophilaceae bacterium]|nr:hypothetical protein [Thermoleophilaceae bacterium]
MRATKTATPIGALACAAAVLGDGTSTAAARLAGAAWEDGERAADALVAAGVLAPKRPLRFTHTVARATIYAFLPPGERAIAHRRAVRVLPEAGADPMALVGHAYSVEPAYRADYLALKAPRLSHTGASLTIAPKLARRCFHTLREPGPDALEPVNRYRRLVPPHVPQARDRSRHELSSALGDPGRLSLSRYA